MAHVTVVTESLVSDSAPPRLLDATMDFQNWLSEKSEDQDRDDQPDCILDYIYDWFCGNQALGGTKGGAKYCHTYEGWLMLVMTIMDEIYRRPFEEESVKEVLADGFDETFLILDRIGASRLPFLPKLADFLHPALNRTIIEERIAEAQTLRLKETLQASNRHAVRQVIEHIDQLPSKRKKR